MPSQDSFGEHAFYGVTDDAIDAAFALAKFGRRVETLTSGITGITCINLVGFFLAAEYHLSGVDDDNVVSTIYVRCEAWLVLTANQL